MITFDADHIPYDWENEEIDTSLDYNYTCADSDYDEYLVEYYESLDLSDEDYNNIFNNY